MGASDVFRKLVARTMTQRWNVQRVLLSPSIKAVGTECIANVIQALTDLDNKATGGVNRRHRSF